jgi:predicted dehydrogenase
MATIAIIGTGFVADYYMTTLANHPDLELAGVWDHDGTRLAAFADFHGVATYPDLAALLADQRIDIVVNLTSPESHYALNAAALEAGKHVYCEKPLAMSVADAQALVALAKARGLTLCGAPANALSDAFELTRGLLDAGRIGRPRLAYAEMEDGPVFRANWQDWKSRSGARWPGIHEFEVGCTLEHAGYGLSWLIGLFGPVARATAFSATAFPDKGPGTTTIRMGADFSVGCLAFESGVTARITCGLAAPRDRSLTILGDTGTLVVRDLWDDRSPVNLAEQSARTLPEKLVNRLETTRGKALPLRLAAGKPVRYPPRKAPVRLPAYPSQIDFARGIQRQAEAIRTGQTPFFSGEVALHLTELALALNAGLNDYTPSGRFTPVRT